MSDMSPIVNLKLGFGGELSGHGLSGSMRGIYDRRTNITGGVMTFNHDPDLENTVLSLSCTSSSSLVFCVFSREINGARNLISVMGLPFRAEADYTMLDEYGTVVGKAKQIGTYREIELDNIEGDVTLNGWFDGPKDIYHSPGYGVYVRQVGPGSIEGVYGQTIFAKGGTFYNLARRRYWYDSGRTLPFDEVWHYKLLSLDIRVEGGSRAFEYWATAFYSPAEAEHGSIPDQAVIATLREREAAAAR